MQGDFKEFEAKSVDEAIILAMKAFHVDFEDLEIKVISEGSKGLFGIVGTKSARILARRVEPLSVHDEKPSEEVPESPEEPAASARIDVQEPSRELLSEAQEIVSELLRLMNISSEVKIRDEGLLEIMGDGSGLIIGKHGQTLDSLQFVLNRIVNKSRQEPVYITLDTEGYRQRHMNYLKSMAIKMGQKARRTGQSVSLEKMNPYDRRIVHLALKNESGLNTKSIGEGIYKKVVIIPRKASRQ